MKVVKFIISILFIGLTTFLNFDNDKFFGDIVTFIAILVGFSITSLTIIANSQFSKHLLHLDNPKNNGETLLHDLIGKFRWSTIIFILTVIVIFIYNFIGTNIHFITHSLFGFNYTYRGLLNSTIWYFTLLSIIKFIELFKMILLFVIRSAEGK